MDKKRSNVLNLILTCYALLSMTISLVRNVMDII